MRLIIDYTIYKSDLRKIQFWHFNFIGDHCIHLHINFFHFYFVDKYSESFFPSASQPHHIFIDYEDNLMFTGACGQIWQNSIYLKN
jgi:hypothetical protein